MGKGKKRKQLDQRAIDSFVDHPGLTEQLLRVQGQRAGTWASLSIRQALSIPAVWRSVSLIAGLIGQLQMLTYRNGMRLDPVPRLASRPDPFGTSRDFYSGTGWNLATRGEAIWYAAALDPERRPISLLNLPLPEVQVDWADETHWARSYKWRDQALDARRVTHIYKALEPGQLRGMGPLQMCGAALSAAAEADEWAARYFAESGVTAVHLHSQVKLDDAEAERIKARWVERSAEAVRVTSGGTMTVAPLGINPAESQLLDTRLHSRGEVAVMFGIPAKLLEYAESGSSLTYQNVGDVMTEFVRQELAPGYLEPIENAISDLLSRSTIGRFDVSGLQRADPKTRFDIHAIAIGNGIYDATYAARDEGIETGAPNAELAPVPAPEQLKVSPI